VVLGALLGGLLIVGLAPEANAEKKHKSVQTEAKWVSFDAEAKQVTIKVVKPGKIKDKKLKKEFKKGKKVTLDVTPEGSIMTRTTVAVNGMKSEIEKIPVGKRVYVYWVVDDSKPSGRFARKIDVIFSAEELAERYGFKD
jgi:hypothetical protein